MHNHHPTPVYLNDCPVCKTGKAMTSCSSWGHAIPVCSRKCGHRYRIWLQIGKATDRGYEFGMMDCSDDSFTIRLHSKSFWGKNDAFEVVGADEGKIALRAEIKRRGSLLKRRTDHRVLKRAQS